MHDSLPPGPIAADLLVIEDWCFPLLCITARVGFQTVDPRLWQMQYILGWIQKIKISNGEGNVHTECDRKLANSGDWFD